MKYFFYTFILFAVFILPIYSQDLEEQDTEDGIITAISIEGLKKTKPHIIEKLLQKYIGRMASEVDINEVYAIIKDTNIVEPETIEIIKNKTDYGKTLTVTVKDKWSIFPVPFFSIASDKWGVGAAVIESNFFGSGDTFLLVGSYGSDSWMGSLMYMKTPKTAGEFGFSAIGMFLNQTAEYTEQTGKDVLRRFNRLSLNPEFSASYSLTDSITTSFGISYHYIMLSDTKNQIAVPENGIQAITLSPRIGIRTSSWDGYLLSEKNASLEYKYRFIIGDDDTQSVSINAVFNHSLIPGFRVITYAGALFSTTSSSPFFESILSPPISSISILSLKYSVLNYVAASAGLEKYLFKFSFGTISLAAAYQAAYTDGVFLHHQFDHGPKVSLQMYFSKIALPGFSLGVAYNVDKNFFQYAANMGISF